MAIKISNTTVIDNNLNVVNANSYNGYIPANRGVTISHGVGLTGGGDLSASRTLSVVANTGIIANTTGIFVNSNHVAIKNTTTSQTFGGAVISPAVTVSNTSTNRVLTFSDGTLTRATITSNLADNNFVIEAKVGANTVGRLSVLSSNGISWDGVATGNGSGITSINASSITLGSLNDARLSNNVLLKNDTSAIITGDYTFRKGNNNIVINGNEIRTANTTGSTGLPDLVLQPSITGGGVKIGNSSANVASSSYNTNVRIYARDILLDTGGFSLYTRSSSGAGGAEFDIEGPIYLSSAGDFYSSVNGNYNVIGNTVVLGGAEGVEINSGFAGNYKPGYINGSTLTISANTNVIGTLTRNGTNVVLETRSISTGNGLNGGGTLSSNRTLYIGEGSGITVSSTAVSVDSTVLRTNTPQSISGDKRFVTATELMFGDTSGGDATLLHGGSNMVLRVYKGDFNILNNTAVTLASFKQTSGNLNIAGSLSQNSDERLKTDIITIDNALSKVNSMRGVEYNKDNSHQIGLIAQEVETIIPEVVTTNEDGYKAVQYQNLVGLLIQAINELTVRVAELEGKE